MFAHVFLASDGSACALKAAVAAAGKFSSRLTILTVYHPCMEMVLEGNPIKDALSAAP